MIEVTKEEALSVLSKWRDEGTLLEALVVRPKAYGVRLRGRLAKVADEGFMLGAPEFALELSFASCSKFTFDDFGDVKVEGGDRLEDTVGFLLWMSPAGEGDFISVSKVGADRALS